MEISLVGGRPGRGKIVEQDHLTDSLPSRRERGFRYENQSLASTGESSFGWKSMAKWAEVNLLSRTTNLLYKAVAPKYNML